MNILRAVAIRGWMTEAELTWLAQQAEIHTKIVEVGSFCGRSCRALADNTWGTVTAVDTWGRETSIHAYGDIEKVFEEFKANIADLTNVRIVRMTSIQAAEYLKGEEFDMVFIDADHNYEPVKADIQAWLPFIKPGGLICGHDYGDVSYEVTKAVNELFSGSATRVVDSIWAKVVN